MMRKRFPPLHRLHPQRIALLKPSALGDIVHALPVLTALRHLFPDAYIAWIVNRSFEPLLQGHSDLNETIPFDRGMLRRGWLSGLAEICRFTQLLRQKKFDLVIDLQGLLRTGLMAWFSRAPRRMGLQGAREGARFAYTDIIPIPNPTSMHAVDRYWRVVEVFGGGDLPKRWDVPICSAARQWATQKLQGWPKPWIAVAVGSRWLTKRWPPEHFAYLLHRAVTTFGGTAIFLGVPEDQPLTDRVLAKFPAPSLDLTGRTTLPQLAAMLQSADLMLANDTGPLHLAAALGVPTVAPYTCTRIDRHGPYPTGGGVATSVACHGSYLKQCDRMICMTELTPERLWPTLCERMRRWESSCRSA